MHHNGATLARPRQHHAGQHGTRFHAATGDRAPSRATGLPLADTPVMIYSTHPDSTRLRTVFDNMETAVFVFGEDGALTLINPAGEMLLATSARQAIGEPPERLFDTENPATQAIRETLRSGQPFSQHALPLLPAGEGRWATVDCTVTPMDDDHGKPAVIVEMSSIDRHLRIARDANQLAQHQVAQTLIRGLAHEIKNPLGGLRGAAQLLERELADPQLQEFTSIIVGEADRLRTLVDKLLGPNRVPQKQLINLHQPIEHVRRLLEAEAPAGVTVIRDYDPSIPALAADSDQLIQAVLNVARNSLEALGEAGGTIVLRTRATRRFTIDGELHRLVARLDIIDDGPGIPADLVERIFYPLVSDRQGGTGLGLSIAQSLIRQHGGLIQCESRPGQTIFSIYLPRPEGADHV